jgi:hypothetical protein
LPELIAVALFMAGVGFVLEKVLGPFQEYKGVRLLLPEIVGLKLILDWPGHKVISPCEIVKFDKTPRFTEAVLVPVQPPPMVTVYVPALLLARLFNVIEAVLAVNPFGPDQE